MTGRSMLGVTLACVVAAACGSSSSASSGSGGGGGGGQMGAACSCPGETDAGDYLCGKPDTSCASSLYCIDGVCSTFCKLDAGTCPAGFVCRQTPHSNLTVYCAPQ